MACGEHGQADLHGTRNEIEAGEHAHPTKAGERLLQVSVHAVQGQSNGPHCQIRGDSGDVLHGEGTGMIQGNQRHAEHSQVHSERDHEKQDLIGARHNAAFHAFRVTFCLHIGKLGEHGGGNGHGQERIRQREPQSRVG